MSAGIIRLLMVAAISTQSAATNPSLLLNRYVAAIGGESALRAVRTRLSEGRFDNGRGLKTRFVLYEEAPNKRTTVVGTDPIDADHGSGRGFDGIAAWDKNFVGTGLRTLQGRELVDFTRDADMLRPLHFLEGCTSSTVEPDSDGDAVVCRTAEGDQFRLVFRRDSGLLARQETVRAAGQTIISVAFDDYREIDGLRLPFSTRVMLPGAAITYTTDKVRVNQPIDPRVFTRPAH